jgi:hypothetical protein
MNKSCEKNPTAHNQNILHVDVLYNIKRKKYKTVCAELAFTLICINFFNQNFLLSFNILFENKN